MPGSVRRTLGFSAGMLWLAACATPIPSPGPATSAPEGLETTTAETPELEGTGEATTPSAVEGDARAAQEISFFGNSLKANGFFFCVQISDPLLQSGWLPRVRRELEAALDGLTPTAHLNIVLFGADVASYEGSAEPFEATPDVKAGMLRFVESVLGDQDPPGSPGLQTASPDLRILDSALARSIHAANLSTAWPKCIVYVVGDQVGGDVEKRLRILSGTTTARNYQNVAIHAFGLGLDPDGPTARFLARLAGANNGTWTCVPSR